MNWSTEESNKLKRKRIRAEAAAWIARLHGPDRTPTLEAGLRRWLAESRLHADEFELATDVWNDSDGLPGGLPPRMTRWNLLSRKQFLLPAALAAACLLAFGWIVHLRLQSTLVTGIGEQRALTLVDGTRLTLNTNSRVRVHYDEGTRTVILESGEVYFDVVHNQQRPFIVQAGDRKVIAVGTSFMVRRADSGVGESLTVTLIEGRVAVAPLTAPNQLPPQPTPDITVLTPGERLRAKGHTHPTVDNTPIDQALGWMHGQLIFDDTPLSEAAEEFNRYSSLKIRVPSGRVGQIPVGGVFRIGDAASFARAVAQSHDLKIAAHGGEIELEPGPAEPSMAAPDSDH